MSSDIFRFRAGKKRPNVILVMADDCSAMEFSCYGNTEHSTPNIDKLGQTGVKFRTCWCTPICQPTRSEIMTGKYGFRTGFYHNNVKPKGSEIGAKLTDLSLLFSQVMKDAGYATAVCGKWQLQGNHDDYGFDEHCMWEKTPAFDGPIEPPEGSLPGRAARYWQPAIVQNGKQLKTNEDDYGPDIFTDFLVDFARRKKKGPFLAYFPMVLTHKTWDFDLEVMGYPAPPELDANGQKTGNKGVPGIKSNVEYMDHLMGRIVRGLEEIGIREETIIMITCDNGTAGYGKGKTYQERGPRVPMVINGPGLVKQIGDSDALIDFSDIFATLVELSGAKLPADYEADGHSFLPILTGEKEHVREWIFSFYKDSRFLRDTRWLLDGDGTFWDCGDNRDEQGYIDVTSSQDPEVLASKARFDEILLELPAPDLS
jgi:arylsulfatase A-like enzyme